MKFSPLPYKLQIEWIVFFCCCLFLALIPFFRFDLYFRDFAIIWEGAYRLSLGQVPYRDFGMPIGPISLLLPALAMKFGFYSYYGLEVCQIVLNILTLLIFWKCLQGLRFDRRAIPLAMLLFTVFYLYPLLLPWYNMTAFTLLLLSLYLAIESRKALENKQKFLLLTFLSGAYAAFSFLAKQDCGGMSVLICLGYFLFYGIFLNKDNKRALFIQWGAFFVGLFTILGVFVALYYSYDLLYWFNIGQERHSSRIPSLIRWGNQTDNYTAVVALLGFLFSFLKKSEKLFLASFLVLCAYVVRKTSGGAEFSGGYFFVCSLYVIWNLVDLKTTRAKEYLIKFAIVLGLSWYGNYEPARFVWNLTQQIYEGKTMVWYTNPYTAPTVKASDYSIASAKPTLLIPETKYALERLIAWMKEYRAEVPTCKLLNVSEFPLLYLETGCEPAKGYPLWFHTGITFFPREIEKMKEAFKQGDYDIVVLQATHENEEGPYRELIRLLQDGGLYARMGSRSFRAPAPSFLHIFIKRKEFWKTAALAR